MIELSGELLTKSPSGEESNMLYGVGNDEELELTYKLHKLNEVIGYKE